MNRESIYKYYEPAIMPKSEPVGNVYWFAFRENKMLVNVINDNYSVPYMHNLLQVNIEPVRTQYLGLFKGCPCYSAEISLGDNPPAQMEFIPLRSLFNLIDINLFLIAGKASQIVLWDQANQFCGRCGRPTEGPPNERAKKCPKCGLISYPQICPAVITAVLRDDKILLAHAKAFKNDMHGLISGFLEPGETLEECVQREIMEEVGIKVKSLKYFGSQPWPYPNSLMVGFTAQYDSGEISVDGVEIEKAAWFDRSNLPELPSKVSIARQIIDQYIQKNL